MIVDVIKIEAENRELKKLVKTLTYQLMEINENTKKFLERME